MTEIPDIGEPEPAGLAFSGLTTAEQSELIDVVDTSIRPLVMKLIDVARDAERLRIAGKIGLMDLLDQMDDNSTIPMKSSEFRGAKELSAREVRRILKGLDDAVKQQFGEDRRVLFARAVGAKRSL